MPLHRSSFVARRLVAGGLLAALCSVSCRTSQTAPGALAPPLRLTVLAAEPSGTPPRAIDDDPFSPPAPLAHGDLFAPPPPPHRRARPRGVPRAGGLDHLLRR